LFVTPAARAASLGQVSLALLGLPSVGSIVRAIVNVFFGTLAGALVPGFLRHATVATIQHLVAVPDVASWHNVGALQGDMVYLAAALLPVTLTVSVLRFWALGFTGAAHPTEALGRAVAATGALVIYPWGVGQIVALTNVLTHAILGFPAVADGLSRMVGVMFAGALLTGTGGVFGAWLMILGIIFAAALYAAQVLVMLAFAVLFVSGPPLIALSVMPETAHIARTWLHVVVALALVPIGWTILFATAGALALDATNFSGSSGGLPSNISAAFAALITFVLAVRLPLLVLGELRNIARGANLRATAHGHGGRSSPTPAAARVQAARTRLRAAAFEGGPALGRSVGQAAGALGAPRGGPAGLTARAAARSARSSGLSRIVPAAAAATAAASGRVRGSGVAHTRVGRTVGARLSRAGSILAAAPAKARAATIGQRPAPRGATSPAAGRARPAPAGAAQPGPGRRPTPRAAGSVAGGASVSAAGGAVGRRASTEASTRTSGAVHPGRKVSRSTDSAPTPASDGERGRPQPRPPVSKPRKPMPPQGKRAAAPPAARAPRAERDRPPGPPPAPRPRRGG
jgi:hypothetical protein